MLINLFIETDSKIHDDLGKTWDDVDWCGTRYTHCYYAFHEDEDVKVPAFSMTADEFKQLSANIRYDNGFGRQEINPWLTVMFRDGTYLQRQEYDGSEWWEYVPRPERPSEKYQPRVKDILCE